MQKPIVIITGASQGLGAALAREYARRAGGLIVTARHRAPLEALAKELEHFTPVIAIAGSVADDDHAHAIIETARTTFGRIDILINNASTLGRSPLPPLEKLGPNTFNELMNVNVRAPLHLSQHALQLMRGTGSGTIVNISSDAGVAAYAGWGGYGASKAALEHLSRTLGEELAGTKVRVIVIDPGNMNTQMHRDAEPGVDLSDLPDPKTVAPNIVRLIEVADGNYSRFEAQAYAGVV
ncbi:MAG: SDR family oxidoreductase [Candidatus Eremiobacteraeota bacterium]|nr:SDR family oxidoreductase [Candidatus Eremiobacteraeota bacterium]